MKWLVSLAVLGAVALGLWFLREPLLNESFDFLVKAEPPSKADIAVVFAGDHNGKRILTAAQLERDGYVPKVLVSGPGAYYESYECDAAIPFAVAHGYPDSYFQHFHGDFTNTRDEAAAIIAELRRQNVKKVLVVTSGYHTRRTSRYFKNLTGIESHMIAAPDLFVNHGTWWKRREGRKIMFLEWAKTAATWFGI